MNAQPGLRIGRPPCMYSVHSGSGGVAQYSYPIRAWLTLHAKACNRASVAGIDHVLDPKSSDRVQFDISCS